MAEKTLEKKKTGRPKGSKKIDLGMQKAMVALEEAKEIQDKMSDKQRKLFVSLLKGYDPLRAAVDSGRTEFFTGITKKVERYITNKDGEREIKGIYTSNIDMYSINDLTEESYAKLNRICKTEVDKYLGDFNHANYVANYKSVIKFLVPEAIGVLTDVATNKNAKDSDRLTAAKDILDRAGHLGDRLDADKTMPVQVNIIMNEEKKREPLPIINIEPEEGEIVG